jgi:hypothetical protein
VNAFLKAAPLAALLGAWGWASEVPPSPEGSWATRDFARRLETEAARASADLRSAPDLAGARVTVRSIDDHGPLRVEVALEPAARELSAAREKALLAGVRARFESFAVVEVIRTEARR